MRELTDTAADAAFAVDASGVVVAWNAAAEALFGVPASEAVGRLCADVVQGADECGAFCAANCAVLEARRRRPIRNFDLQVRTGAGTRWCNVSVLVVGGAPSEALYSMHIFRPIDAAKRLEQVVRELLAAEGSLSPEAARALLSSPRAAARLAVLTPREIEVLRLMANGLSTAVMADRLSLSRATVNNHVQHVLGKLQAHTRLEAIRRAENAGLI